MFVINIFRKIAITVRTSIRFVMLSIVAAILVISTVVLFYHPTYAVSVNGQLVGYTENKSELQEKINNYIAPKEEENLAFVQIDAMPTYELCLLKKDIQTNDDEIFSKVTDNGTKYYKYYAITDDKNEKTYVASFKEAEEIVEGLKKKKSANSSDIGIVEKYDTSLKEFTGVDTAISKLYEKPKVTIKKTTSSYSSPSVSNYSSGKSYSKVEIGIALIKPVSGTIMSRFGSNDSVRSHTHTGLDIAAPKGTPIKAAAGGTVTYSGNANDGYGNYVVISHGNGIQTVYAHCSRLLVSKGQHISQGEVIAKVGSTGNSTGNHLHLEIRKNGVSYNPQYYLY